MNKPLKKLSMSEARLKLTHLHYILRPGEVLEITKRGKPYARVHLLGDKDLYESVLESLDALPEPEEGLQMVAENYKSLLYENNK